MDKLTELERRVAHLEVEFELHLPAIRKTLHDAQEATRFLSNLTISASGNLALTPEALKKALTWNKEKDDKLGTIKTKA